MWECSRHVHLVSLRIVLCVCSVSIFYSLSLNRFFVTWWHYKENNFVNKWSLFVETFSIYSYKDSKTNRSLNSRSTAGVKMTPFHFHLLEELSKSLATGLVFPDFSSIMERFFGTKTLNSTLKIVEDTGSYTSQYGRGHFDPWVWILFFDDF